MNTYAGRFDSSVEVGHTYAPNTLTPFNDDWRTEHGVELPVFEPPTAYHEKIVATALAYSSRPLLLSLVDDIGVSGNESFLTELSVIEGLGPHDVYYESSYHAHANELISRLRKDKLPPDWRLSEDKRKLVFGTGKSKLRIPLVGFANMPQEADHPSCQILDTAWMLDRIQSIAPKAATILPEGFKAQQKQVAALASLFSEFDDALVTSIFIDSSGSETERFEWQL